MNANSVHLTREYKRINSLDRNSELVANQHRLEVGSGLK